MDSKNFVTYEQALSLKRLGFDDKCDHYYTNTRILFENLHYRYIRTGYIDFNHEERSIQLQNISAPTLYQAAEWLRNKKYSVEPYTGDAFDIYEYQIDIKTENPYTKLSENEYSSYIEALSAGISEAIEIINEKQYYE